MEPTGKNIDALLEMDRFVRMMASACGTREIVPIVRAYLASWTKDRVARLQDLHAGWAPFDDCGRPFVIDSAGDVRQIRNSLRIRCRELEASGVPVAGELLELDLFFFFANESLGVHEPSYRDIVGASASLAAWQLETSADLRKGASRERVTAR